MSTIPFSYHLYHRPTQLHYYGIKHAKNCNPTDLWTTYFSSSSIIKNLIKEHGIDSFDVKIRKTFTTSADALLWEHKVLRRINASAKSNWANRHNGGTKFRGPSHHSVKSKSRMSLSRLGKLFSEQHKAKLSESALLDRKKRKQAGYTRPVTAINQSVQTRKENIKAGIINPYSTERNTKMAASKTGTKRQYLPDGSFIMVKKY